MYGVMGATGHVGSAVVDYLVERGEEVLAITHDRDKVEELARKGTETAIADVHDPDTLRATFKRCRRAFLLNPPADVSTDTDAEERETVRCILKAIDGSGLELVVAESTYGAQPGEHCGYLNVLYELEQGLKAQDIPAVIQRAAYYMSNWDQVLDPVKADGKMPTFLPVQMPLPMVAPVDLGRNAGKLLIDHDRTDETVNVEGPKQYSPQDVANAFAKALGRDVEPQVVPESDWERQYRKLGFSPKAASSYAKMTRVSVESGFAGPENPTRGSITLVAYIESLIAKGD